MTRRRKDRFVCGYKAAGRCIYGSYSENGYGTNWVYPLNELDALRVRSNFPEFGAMIYELVPRPDLVKKAQKKAKVKK